VSVPIVDLSISNADLISLLKFSCLENTPIGVSKQRTTGANITFTL